MIFKPAWPVHFIIYLKMPRRQKTMEDNRKGGFGRRTEDRRDYGRRDFDRKPSGERRGFSGDRKSYGEGSDRPRRSFGDNDRPRRSFGEHSDRPRRSFGDRPERPYGERS